MNDTLATGKQAVSDLHVAAIQDNRHAGASGWEVPGVGDVLRYELPDGGVRFHLVVRISDRQGPHPDDIVDTLLNLPPAAAGNTMLSFNGLDDSSVELWEHDGFESYCSVILFGEGRPDNTVEDAFSRAKRICLFLMDDTNDLFAGRATTGRNCLVSLALASSCVMKTPHGVVINYASIKAVMDEILS